MSNNCKICDNPLEAYDVELICPSCKQQLLFERLSAEDAEGIDNLILDNSILEGMSKLRDLLRISLSESIDLYSWRYKVLRKIDSHKFKLSEDDYWKNFYS